eukprot:scaffold126_cov142-Skeletonema_marinoi.AAC.7
MIGLDCSCHVEARNDPFGGIASRDEEEEDHHRYNTRSSAQPPPPPPSPPRNQPPSPPRNPRPDSTRDDERSRGYDPEGVGHNLRDSLGIFGLGPSAVWMEVRAEFRQFSRIYIYHPDKHKSTRTKMSDDEAKAFFQLFNNARDFLEDHYRRTGRM